MYTSIFKTWAIGLNILAALVTVAPYPANAQFFSNPVDLNQSRQFFNEGTKVSEPTNVQDIPSFTDLEQTSQFFIPGQEQIEQKIELLPQGYKMPAIEISQYSYRFQNIQNFNSIDAETKLKPFS